MNPDPDKPNAELESNATSSTDHLEQRAAETADEAGRSQPTDADRKKALEDMKATSPPNAGEEDASH